MSSFRDHLIGPGLLALVALLVWSVRIISATRKDSNALAELPTNSRRPRPWLRGVAGAVAMASIYLLLFRGISFLPQFHLDNRGGAILMSFSFLFLGPFIAGVITVWLGSRKEPWSNWECIVNPWIPLGINLAIALGIAWEGIICAVFILPPAMISASLGGLAAGMWQRYRHKRAGGVTMLCFAAVPLILAMVEVNLNQPLQTRVVETSTMIHAPIDVVWRNIERVPAIAKAELRPSWANTIGFPRPVEATLSHEGVGGVRNPSFERGLNFLETVTDWQPGHRIAFTIQADTAHIPTATLDEHVTVGGRFFDVLTGEYNLEPQVNGDTLLHLSSRERLSTDFNLYAALWSDAVMADMQDNILGVVKRRCEAQFAQRAHLNAVH